MSAIAKESQKKMQSGPLSAANFTENQLDRRTDQPQRKHSRKVSPLRLLFCATLQDARVLRKGIIHKLLHAASLLFLGRLPQLVVVPLNPPAPPLASHYAATSSEQTLVGQTGIHAVQAGKIAIKMLVHERNYVTLYNKLKGITQCSG